MIGAALCFAATLTACSGGEDADVADAGDTRPLSAASTIYHAKQCAVCHPLDGTDSMAGPGLAGIHAVWNEDDLTEFLMDPPAYLAKSQRLNELVARYPMPMPVPQGVSEEDANLMARWLLAGRPK